MELLAGYGSASEEGNEVVQEQQPKLLSLNSALSIVAAPPVSESLEARSLVVNVKDSQVFTNPTYQNLWKPEQGPTPPWGLSVARGQKNILTGFVQDEAMNDFVFEQQHHLFQTTGMAEDPTEKNRIIVAIEKKKRRNERLRAKQRLQRQRQQRQRRQRPKKAETGVRRAKAQL